MVKCKENIGVDVCKFVCALLIVYIHTYCWDLGKLGWWIKFELAQVAIPFFFIATGFFWRQGIEKSENKSRYLRKYVLRLLRLYIFWSILTLPVQIYNLRMLGDSYSPILKVLFWLRSFLLLVH